jgi:glycosyltransferase involved in cell wall biosynthesis
MAREALPITVIIPCFNDGETLDCAVQSAVGAGVTEVVIVNDGSTDKGTCGLLERYARNGVTVLNISNGGPAAARSQALTRVSTPYVFNLDADDELLPDGLARLYRVLCQDPSQEVAWGDYCVFGEWNHLQETSECIDPWKLTLINDLPVSALFRTETLRRVGAWQTDGYEDWDLWMSFAEHGIRGRRVSLPVFRYRTWPSAAMRGRTRDQLRHDALLSQLRARHPGLFNDRVRAWRQSSAPWRVRIALSLASLVPLSGRPRLLLLWRANQISNGRFGNRLREGCQGLPADVGSDQETAMIQRGRR